MPAWASALGVFDLETTGIDTSTARIVTAHVGVIDETGAVVERKDWIVNPGVPIPEGAAAVHGITDDRAQRFGRPPGEVVAEILAAIRSVFLRGFPLVVYNAPYDLTLLAAEAERHRLWPLEVTAPIVDPFVLDKEVDRFRKGKRTLTAAAAEYGVDLTDAHDAGADAIAAGRLAQAIARRHPDALAMEAQELHDAQVAWCADQAERFQAYMREKRDPGFTASGGWPRR
nr:exonuclease domain-containing protein [Amnibacterium kyonggiense]